VISADNTAVVVVDGAGFVVSTVIAEIVTDVGRGVGDTEYANTADDDARYVPSEEAYVNWYE
jgi:hypothetical protein